MLKNFSIDIKRKKTKFDKTHTDGKDSADVADNIWDIDHLEVSKKINVGFKTKFFFSTIPMYTVSMDDNGERNYTPVTDDMFGTQMYYSFTAVWNKIMKNLYMCDSFDARDPKTGELSTTSFVYTLKRLSDSGDSFFKAVYDKIEPLIDEDDENLTPEEKLEIRTGIINTVQSANNRITVMNIKKPREFKPKQSAAQMDMGAQAAFDPNAPIEHKVNTDHITLDIAKSWEIQDSAHLQSKYILSRDWSENLAVGTGAVQTDPKTGKSSVSSTYVQTLKTLYNNAVKAVKKPAPGDKRTYTIEEAKSVVCKMLNYMAIPVDG